MYSKEANKIEFCTRLKDDIDLDAEKQGNAIRKANLIKSNNNHMSSKHRIRRQQTEYNEQEFNKLFKN